MNYLFLLLAGFIFVSCNKENIQPEENSTEILMPTEQFVAAFTAYEREISFDIKGYQQCGSTHIKQAHGFRLTAGQQHNGAYFYALEKKAHFTNSCGETILNSPWSAVSGYYRYSFQDKVSYFYQDLNDSSPVVLFDFNINVGDTVLLDASQNILFVVQTIAQQSIQNINFPVISGTIIKYQSNAASGASIDVSNSTNGSLSIAPFSSNPFWFNQDFIQYSEIGWNENNFCDYQDFAAIDKLTIKSRNTVSSSLFSEYMIYNLGPY